MYFIILLGIVSLFGDVTYQGARSVAGPYLYTLGASGGVVSLVAGIGEFAGYALRLASGYLVDRTKAYWILTFIGYGLLISIPLLAFASYWQLAAVLIILEEAGGLLFTRHWTRLALSLVLSLFPLFFFTTAAIVRASPCYGYLLC